MAHQPHASPTYTGSAPIHPVPQLQAPFEESMLESGYDDADAGIYLDPVTRRNTLLESPTYIRVVAGRWKQKPGERFHPLWKLIAQISFGIHLLAESMAKSEDDVMQILQAHVDEIDGFLERTTEDFDLAQEDIQERLRCLKLPLSHPATFDKMLEDRNFRLSIVDGNEKIEHIVDRTARAMKDSLKDVQKGYESTTCLEAYLHRLARTWHRISVEHEAVFVAMLGNVEGWRKAFTALHTQGNKLNGSLKKLTDIINEMQARAGEVSRRLLHQAKVQHHQVMGRPTGRHTPTSRFQTTPTKDLPNMPSRPPLRQTASNDTARSNSSMRMSSQETLRRQAMLARAQSPQNFLPSPQNVQNANSPTVVQVRTNSSSRVRSIVPSLFDPSSSSRASTNNPQSLPLSEEQPERSFPPVELPAHVPEETMQKAPMSKQNRLSMGLNSMQSKIEKRNSKVGTSALIDLLRAGPADSRSSDTSRSRSLEASRRTSIVRSADQIEGTALSHNVLPADDPAPAHTECNMRRPMKGTQPWFDAEDDSPVDADKFSVTADNRFPATNTVNRSSQAITDFSSQPGTPAWAVTTFAQAESRKELLKQGAFRSHPPEMPLGSPPTEQSSAPSNSMAVPVRRPSNSSSAGQSTLGEPGPEVAASDAGSASASSGRYRLQDPKRASAYAPEVVSMKNIPPFPPAKKHFVAEMEGSTPPAMGSSSMARTVAIELEAPHHHFVLPPRPQTVQPVSTASSFKPYQQHFVLPPRPQSSQPPSTAQQASAVVQTGSYQQHFVLPPRTASKIKSTTSSQAQQAPKTRSYVADRCETLPIIKTPSINTPESRDTEKPVLGQQIHEVAPSQDGSEVPQSNDMRDTLQENSSVQEANNVLIEVQPVALTVEHSTKFGSEKDLDVTTRQSAEVVEQFAKYSEKLAGERLPNSVYVPTPNIPIPPSPLDDLHPSSREEDVVHDAEPLYILPAIAYKAPHLSPRLPPDPFPQARASFDKQLQEETSNTCASHQESTEAETKDAAFPAMTEVMEVTAREPEITALSSGESLEQEPEQEPEHEPEVFENFTRAPNRIEELSNMHNTASDSILEEDPKGTLDHAQFATRPPVSEEYDPFKPKSPADVPNNTSDPVRIGRNNKITPIKIVPIPENVELTREMAPEDKEEPSSPAMPQSTTSDWKAFFKGQPSPSGSNLSIRSIRRESYMEQQAQPSPALLSPASISSKHPFPPSPVVGPGTKEAVWFSSSKRGSNASTQPKETVGLGITTVIGVDVV